MARTRNLGNLTDLLSANTTTGIVSANTAPAQFDNSAQIPTTGWVTNALGNYRGMVAYTTNTALTAADVGKFVQTSGTVTLTLPDATTVATGSTITVYTGSTAGYVTTVTCPNGAMGGSGSNGTATVTIQAGVMNEFVAAGSGATATAWIVLGAGGAMALTSPGYQRLPSGLIIQWAQSACANATTTTTVFPLAFPTACLNVSGTGYQASGNQQAYVVINGKTATQFTWNAFLALGGSTPTLASTAAVQNWWIAVGY